jgi:hypothetical protein
VKGFVTVGNLEEFEGFDRKIGGTSAFLEEIVWGLATPLVNGISCCEEVSYLIDIAHLSSVIYLTNEKELES